MLCFEGISLMLNIFNGKATSPNYRLVSPASGELQTITVHEDVRIMAVTRNCVWKLIRTPDFESKAICSWSHSTKHQLYSSTIRVFHSATRQASSKSCSATDSGRNWYPWSRHNQRAIHLWGISPKGYRICAFESNQDDKRCGHDEVFRGSSRTTKEESGLRLTLPLERQTSQSIPTHPQRLSTLPSDPGCGQDCVFDASYHQLKSLEDKP